MSILENSKIKLRALEPYDVDLLYEWENNTDVWLVSNTLTPFSKYILTKYIETSHQNIYQTGQLRLMIDAKIPDGDDFEFRTVGSIDLFDFEPFHLRAGVGILINNMDDRRKKHASEALDLLIYYAFNTLQLHQLYCNVLVDNEGSIKLFEKCGFKAMGIKKHWIKTENGWKDELSMQLINNNLRNIN